MATFNRTYQKILQTKLQNHSKITQILTQKHKLYHKSQKQPPNIQKIFNKDWLSPNEVAVIFKTIQPNSALSVFRHVSSRKDYKPTLPLYHTLILKLSHVKNFDEIDNIYSLIKTQKSLQLSDEFFYDLIRVYGNVGGLITRAVDILFEMPRFRCYPSVKTFNLVLNLLVTSKKFDLVEQVFKGAPKLCVEIDACSLNIMIKGCCNRGLLNNALQVFDEFPRLGLVPSKITYSTLMHCMCKLGKVDDAFEALDVMKKGGVSPDAVTYNVLISGLRKVGRVDEAIEVFDKMGFVGCRHNKGTYQEVLYGLLEGRRFVESIKFVERMRFNRLIPSFSSYKLLLQGLCEEGMVGEVEWVLESMVGAGCLPKQEIWYTVLQKMFGKRATGNLEVFSEMLHK